MSSPGSGFSSDAAGLRRHGARIYFSSATMVTSRSRSTRRGRAAPRPLLTQPRALRRVRGKPQPLPGGVEVLLGLDRFLRPGRVLLEPVGGLPLPQQLLPPPRPSPAHATMSGRARLTRCAASRLRVRSAAPASLVSQNPPVGPVFAPALWAAYVSLTPLSRHCPRAPRCIRVRGPPAAGPHPRSERRSGGSRCPGAETDHRTPRGPPTGQTRPGRGPRSACSRIMKLDANPLLHS